MSVVELPAATMMAAKAPSGTSTPSAASVHTHHGGRRDDAGGATGGHGRGGGAGAADPTGTAVWVVQRSPSHQRTPGECQGSSYQPGGSASLTIPNGRRCPVYRVVRALPARDPLLGRRRRPRGQGHELRRHP